MPTKVLDSTSVHVPAEKYLTLKHNYGQALLLIQTLAGRMSPIAVESAIEQWEARCAEQVPHAPAAESRFEPLPLDGDD